MLFVVYLRIIVPGMVYRRWGARKMGLCPPHQPFNIITHLIPPANNPLSNLLSNSHHQITLRRLKKTGVTAWVLAYK